VGMGMKFITVSFSNLNRLCCSEQEAKRPDTVCVRDAIPAGAAVTDVQ